MCVRIAFPNRVLQIMRGKGLIPRCLRSVSIFSDNTHQHHGIYEEASVTSVIRPEASLELIVVIVLILLLFGSFPVFPYSRDWGYRGSGVLGTVLLIVVILWLLHVV
jgi:hypothetical protein